MSDSQKYRSEFFSLVPDLLSVSNMQGYFVELNAAWETVLGWSIQELCSKPYSHFIHPEDLKKSSQVVERVAGGEPSSSFENRYRCKDGSYKWFRWTGTIDVKNGLLYGIARDVTKLKEVELNLVEKNLQISSVFLALEEHAIVTKTDAQGRITYVNKKFEEISGYTALEVLGSDHRILNSGHHPKAFFKEMYTTIKASKAWRGEIKNRAKNGTHYWVDTTIAPSYDSTGSIGGFVSVRYDVTEKIKKGKEIQAREAQLSEAQKIAKLGNWTLDTQTNKVQWSEQMYEIFSQETSRGSLFFDPENSSKFHPEDREKVLSIVKKCVQDGKPFQIRGRVNLKQELKWVEIRGQGTKDASGKVIQLSGTCQDITEVILERSKNQELADQLYAVTRSSPGLICRFVLKADGTTAMPFVVPEGLKMLDVTYVEYLQDNNVIYKMVHPEDQPGIQKAILESAQKLSPFKWTGRLVLKNQSEMWIEIRSIPQRGKDGSTIWNGIINDITKEKELAVQLEVEKLKSLQSAKLATLGEMSAGIAHEINNPLAIIQGHVKLIKKNINDPQKLDEKITAITKAVERIAKIITGLRKFARSSSGNAKHPFSINQIIQEVAPLVQNKATRHNVAIHYENASDALIYCEEVEIQQVLVNLLNNSIDAIKKLPGRWVKLSAFEEGAMVVIQVTDSGPGIPEAVRKKLFSPFFTTKEVGEGTGLGMSISKGIIEDHKGSIQLVENSKNTCFEIRLPILEAEVKRAA